MATEFWMEDDGLHVVNDGVEYIYEGAYIKSLSVQFDDDSVKIEQLDIKTSPMNEYFPTLQTCPSSSTDRAAAF